MVLGEDAAPGHPLDGVGHEALALVEAHRVGAQAGAAGDLPVRYRPLGRTGIEVSAYCLGTMMFGAVGNPDHDDCVRIIHAALDRGINFVDTADMYARASPRRSSARRCGGAATTSCSRRRCHFPMGDGPNRSGNSRRWICSGVEDSLRRLQTDWIDLYQVHRPDPATDIEETLVASSPTSCTRARSARSAARRSRPSRSSRPTTSRSARGPAALPHRAAAVLDARPRDRDRGAAGLPSATAWACWPGARWRPGS